MFEVNEVLLLTKDAAVPDSYVIEVCENFVPELAGFYVCLTKECMAQVREYINTLPFSSFILKTFDDDAVNGLQLLLNQERLSSYTEEFVKVYGGIDNLLLSYSAFVGVEETSVNTQETQVEFTGDSTEDVSDFVDDSIFENAMVSQDSVEDVTPKFEKTPNLKETPATDEESIKAVEEAPPMWNNPPEENIPTSNTPANTGNAEEVFLMLRAIATKLGVMDYDDEQVLSKADMRNAQIAVRSLAPIIVQEAMMGALGLAESKEDLAAVTRFLELFYSYIKENNLS